MADTPRKVNRLFLYVPLVLAVLLLGGYTVLWFIGKGIMREEITEFVGDERGAGRTIEYENVSIRGFPMSLRAQIEEFNWADPGAWDWSGETLHIVTMPFDPTRLIFAPRGPQTVSLGSEALDVTPNDLQVGISETEYSIEGNEFTLQADDGKTLTVGGLKGNWYTVEEADWIAVASARHLTYQESESRTVTIPVINIKLSHTPALGEAVKIDAAAIAVHDGQGSTPTLLQINGRLGIDREDYPAGRLNITYRDEAGLLSVLEQFELLPPDELAEAATVLKAYRSGRNEATVPFALHDGHLYISAIAEVKLGALPKVR